VGVGVGGDVVGVAEGTAVGLGVGVGVGEGMADVSVTGRVGEIASTLTSEGSFVSQYSLNRSFCHQS